MIRPVDLIGGDDAAFVRLGRAMERRGLQADAAFFVPGRIEVLGKHTDYAGGRSLLCAVRRGIGFAVSRTSDDSAELHVESLDTGDVATIAVATNAPGRPGHWSDYARVVTRRLAANFGIEQGGRVYFTSDLPVAAGISSSSALVVGVFMSLDWLNGLQRSSNFGQYIPSQFALGDYLGCVENGRDYPGLPGTSGVGTTGGSEDHTAILCSLPDVIRQFSFAPTKHERDAPMAPGHVFVVCSSGVTAEKTGAALGDYNRLGALAQAAVDAWNRYAGAEARNLGDILSRVPCEDLESAIRAYGSAGFSEDDLVARARQFADETYAHIPNAVDALERHDLEAFGEAVRRSQQGAEEGLRNQVPQTVHLVQSALEEGAVAASAFGAGFGGSVWAMTPHETAEAFMDRWASAYRAAFPESSEDAQLFVDSPGPAARQW